MGAVSPGSKNSLPKYFTTNEHKSEYDKV